MKPRSIVVLTGAGISAESGLKTFRDAGGLWENHRVEDVATPEAFMRDPVLVHRFYNARRTQLNETTPNAAHIALAKFDQEFQGEFLLVTQNVDDLHGRAGSQRLLHMHGELRKARCAYSEKVFAWSDDLSLKTVCPCCARAGSLRPHIVWFGEMPLGLDQIYEALERCDLFVAIGTSGQVHPAASFVSHVRGRARTVEINLDRSETFRLFDEGHYGPASVEVPKFFTTL